MENDKLAVPRHIAVIMDGNGRWAKQRGLPRVEGHIAGAERVREVLRYAREFGVEYMTLYAFSTENWKRSREEVDALMDLLSRFIDGYLDEMKQNNVRLLVTGRIDGLPERAANDLKRAMAETASLTGHTLILALNYGGRSEIADAAKKIAEEVRHGRLDPVKIDEQLFSRYLYLPDVPDPDLMIRTSGEFRLSNFLLWELSYAEFYVTDTYWPDFDREEFRKAIESYSKRDRRFGGRK
ncbi:MAG: isoprenyl transferase [Victivallales bacterium]|jgi:di-trans,poly-cis-decaprenylcistransferase